MALSPAEQFKTGGLIIAWPAVGTNEAIHRQQRQARPLAPLRMMTLSRPPGLPWEWTSTRIVGAPSMRKTLMALACLLFMSGLVVATEVTLVKYDGEKKEVTVKEGDRQKTYRLTDKTKVFVLKDGKSEDSTVDTAIKLLGNARAKGRLKFDITTDQDSIAELRLKPRRAR